MTTHHLVPRLSRVHSRLPAFPGIGIAGFDRFFSDIWGPARPISESSNRVHGFVPRVDIDESKSEIRLSAELPGLTDGDFEVLLEAEVLTIKGERKNPRLEERREDGEEEVRGYSRVESVYGSFQRSFRLPFEVDPEVVKASYKNGILEVTVPKPAEAEPKERIIPVTTA